MTTGTVPVPGHGYIICMKNGSNSLTALWFEVRHVRGASAHIPRYLWSRMVMVRVAG